MKRSLLALLMGLVLLVGAGCSGDGDAGSATTTTAPGPTLVGGTLVGDDRCEDATGDVYLTGDPDAAPTGRLAGIDLVLASAEVGEDDLRLRFETVERPTPEIAPEFIAFVGPPGDPSGFEVRAVGADQGWALRVVRFDEERPAHIPLDATVSQHGTVVEFTIVRDDLPPLGSFVSFAFASTGSDDVVALNDECFPFEGRTPVGG